MVAGVTLAALAIPEVMGYTKIAGTPVITGLYTILIPAIAFALLGSSRHLVVGGDSATAAILFAGIAALGVSGLKPDTNHAPRKMGSTTQRVAVAANAFDDQPPHLRYQLKANVTATTQTVKTVTASQSTGRLMGFGGRSGRK